MTHHNTINHDSNNPFWYGIKDLPVFCRFNVVGDIKYPIDLKGNRGIGANATVDATGSYDRASALDFPFMGISLMKPIMVGELFLVCIDMDWKRSPSGQAEPEQLMLMAELSSDGVAYETSFSGKGCHYWALFDQKDIPKSVKLANNCEIEVFSGFEGQRANVLITDYDYEGDLKQTKTKFPEGHIQIEAPKPPVEAKAPTATKSDLIQLLSYIPSDDYQTWIRVGMILKSELADEGYELWEEWSKKSDAYDPFVMGAKWDSFKGVGLATGSLVLMAKEFGYVPPKHEKATAYEDFSVNPETGEVRTPDFMLSARRVSLSMSMEAPDWVVDGIIPNGVGVIAGSAGVGKTTALVPIAAAIAGFKSHLSNVDVKLRRKVIYVTEDDAQVCRMLFGILKWLQTDQGGRVDFNELNEWFQVYNSKRMTEEQLRYVLKDAYKTCLTNQGGIDAPPLVVLDTAAANIDLENENDNAQISKYMAICKEIYTLYRMPIIVVAHLTKTAKGVDVDNLDTLSARGGGAWEADANWTAILSTQKESEIRILKMNKRRVELLFNEIEFDSTTHEEWVKDKFGDTVAVTYRYTVPKRSDVKQRIAKSFEDKENKLLEAIMKLDYPSKNEIIDASRVNKNIAIKLLDDLVEKGKLELLSLPESVRKKGRTTYYSVIPVDTRKTDFD